MTDKWTRFIGAALAIIGITAIAIGLSAQRPEIAANYRLYWLILALDGAVLCGASLAVIFMPQKWAVATQGALILFVLASITSRSMVPYIESAPWCISRDADGYTPYALYLNNQQTPMRENAFFRDSKVYRPYFRNLSIAFSPDGQAIVSGSGDGFVRLWDRQGTPIGQPFRGHESYVTSVTFGPNGQTIASGSGDGTVRLWDRQGRPIGQPFRGHESYVTSVTFSPDGQTIASGSWDGTIRLWDHLGIPIGKPLRGHESCVTSVAFSPDGQTIASGSGDGTIRLWDRHGIPIGKPFREHESYIISSVAFSPDAQIIASCGNDGFVRLWSRQGNLMDQRLGTGHYVTNIVTFSPDGQLIAIGCSDGYVRLWDRQGNAFGQPVQVYENYVTSVAFSPDGQAIASGSWDGTIRLWDRQGNPTGQPFRAREVSVDIRRMTFLPILPDYFRQSGYPLILSLFMRVTGQNNACAAEIIQPLILGALVTFCIVWARRKLGLSYAAAIAIPFLDPTNDMTALSSLDLTEFLLAILLPIVAVLLYQIVLSKGKTRRYFLAWLILTFLVFSIKVLVGIIIILLCFSIFIVLCTGKLSGYGWSYGYNLARVSQRLLLIMLSTIVMYQMHTYLSPGASTFNRQAVLALCFWIPAPNSKDQLMRKIKRMQELAERHSSTRIVYSGAGLVTAAGSWPPIYAYLPVLGHFPMPLIDPDDNKILELSPKEVERGAYLLIKTNPLPLLYVGAAHAAKDYKNLLMFSHAGRKLFPYSVICASLLFVGIFFLYKRYSLVTASICVAYILYFAFLSLVAVPVIRLLLPFSVFYYIAFVSGEVAIYKFFLSMWGEKIPFFMIMKSFRHKD